MSTRQTYVVPAGQQVFIHHDPMGLYATCRTEAGQTCCSCGRLSLEWTPNMVKEIPDVDAAQ